MQKRAIPTHEFIKKMNICVLTNKQTQNKVRALKSSSRFLEFISFLGRAHIMGLVITGEESSSVKNKVLLVKSHCASKNKHRVDLNKERWNHIFIMSIKIPKIIT